MNDAFSLTPLPQSSTLIKSLDAKTLQHAHDVLQQQLWFFPIPTLLKPAFVVNQQEQFRRLAHTWIPLLYVMVILEVAVGFLFFHTQLQGWTGGAWLMHLGACLGICTLMTWCTRQPLWLASYTIWLSAAVVFCVVCKLYMALILPTSHLAQYQLIITLMMMMVSLLAIRLPLACSISSCILGMGLASGLAWLSHHIINLYVLVILWVHIGLCGFIAFLVDRQEKLSFLQMILLNYESRQRDELNQQLLYLSQTDGLSGLSNRRHFEQRLQHEWQRAKRHQHILALVMIDIDYFKAYNDHYGHLAGDECLRQVAQLIQGTLGRSADLAVRFGGEEFVLLLPHTDHAGAYEVAKRVMLAIDQAKIRHDYGVANGYISVSIGVAARFPHTLRDAQQLLDLADAALYTAKHQGRHQIHLSIADES
jgi:diguanylate cyclase (GGDEF)-like protein